MLSHRENTSHNRQGVELLHKATEAENVALENKSCDRRYDSVCDSAGDHAIYYKHSNAM